MTEATEDQPFENKPGEDKPVRKKQGKAAILFSWTVLSIFIAMIADFTEPAGSLTLWLFLIGLGAVILAYLARKPARAPNLVPHTAIFTIIMGITLLLQLFASPEDRGEDRGFLASNISPIASLQTAILPLSENHRRLLQLGNRINRGNPVERVEAARALYADTTDAITRQQMLERMMESGDSALVQTAILLRMKELEGDMLKLVPLDENESNLLVRRLSSYAFQLRSVDVESGSLKLEGNAPSKGTVGSEGIEMGLYIALLGKNRLMEVTLQPDAQMRLRGEAQIESGERVPVELPLF